MYRSSLLSRMIWHQRPCTKLGRATDQLLDYARPTITLACRRSVVTTREEDTAPIEDSYVKKFMKSLGLMDQSRTRLKLAGYFLYECIPDQVNYVEWFNKCNLNDTFTSWFNVTELHVWLLMVRCMSEDLGEGAKKDKYVKGEGHFIRNCIIEALWADVSNRIKLLEGANPAIARKQVSELSEQFQAALVSYDEGLQDDRVLASAIWRRFYGMASDAAPQDLETIVKFVRHQISELDKIKSDDLRKRTKIAWLSIGDDK